MRNSATHSDFSVDNKDSVCKSKFLKVLRDMLSLIGKKLLTLLKMMSIKRFEKKQETVTVSDTGKK